MPFRYDVQVNGRTNVYEYKPLADSVDRLALRPTLFGLIFAGNFGKPQRRMPSWHGKYCGPNRFNFETGFKSLFCDVMQAKSCACQQFRNNNCPLFDIYWTRLCRHAAEVSDHTLVMPIKPKFWLVEKLALKHIRA